MKPLVLADIATEVELHESTVSRATTRKYMHTPRGRSNSSISFKQGPRVKVAMRSHLPLSKRQSENWLQRKMCASH
ncbi:MAG: hypothetical protein CM15mP74_00800 [Halieaceae bacterium]|nr:MAG: hypothetical protein CM15mP74_00800 [Halieaceae bacterium]